MNDKNVMIDIETLGTAANSVILSIGAVEFGPEGIGREFYVDVDIDSCQKKGLKIDGRTIAWWMTQGEDARALFQRDGESLESALHQLATAFDWSGTQVWCNGLNFDLPILDFAYRACGMDAPWAYYNARDYRTLRYDVPKETRELIEVEPAVAHDALEDARAQALTLLAIRDLQREHCPRHLRVV